MEGAAVRPRPVALAPRKPREGARMACAAALCAAAGCAAAAALAALNGLETEKLEGPAVAEKGSGGGEKGDAAPLRRAWGSSVAAALSTGTGAAAAAAAAACSRIACRGLLTAEKPPAPPAAARVGRTLFLVSLAAPPAPPMALVKSPAKRLGTPGVLPRGVRRATAPSAGEKGGGERACEGRGAAPPATPPPTVRMERRSVGDGALLGSGSAAVLSTPGASRGGLLLLPPSLPSSSRTSSASLLTSSCSSCPSSTRCTSTVASPASSSALPS